MKTVNIFFPTVQLRDDWLKSLFGYKAPIQIKEIIKQLPAGIQCIGLKGSWNSIPGFWVKVQFKDDPIGKKQLKRMEAVTPSYWIDKNVYFPKEALAAKEMECLWRQKYDLEKETIQSEAWKLFLKEIKQHCSQERMEIAGIGLMYIYRHNPYFLKKYKRFYLFEDFAYFYEAKGELHKSIKYLRAQASLQPESAEAYLNMSSFLILNGLSHEAIDVCHKGMQINEDDEYLNNNLLIAYLNEGYYEAALEHLKKKVRRDPENSTNWKFIGDVFSEMGRDLEAIKYYHKALQIRSADLHNVEQDIYYGLAICNQQLRRFKEAIKYYHKMLRYNSTDPKVLLNLSKIYGDDLKKYDKAQFYAEKIVELFPQNGYGHHNLGLVYLYTGRLDSAKWHLYQARRLIPDYQPVYEAIQKLKKIKRNKITARTSQ
ncbi:tetratricopeptide repeat protein [Geosporobacter ferrireducens]|uniref:Uncharacterized protein n=1 Tax=Geosporobacter ferrireducens TaxID=1424294 RepID=A0A1D8GCD7_9FIRM|nr:tetratricopeptide repeat protein [Geosporobacter ferrireducens]AOT68552.1 hypothetical protein Gferi_02445 [Geosporobacter ferrireducens]MTI54017.1 tetratricopeptide repeat protein [Geosporobacter ferrireducens]